MVQKDEMIIISAIDYVWCAIRWCFVAEKHSFSLRLFVALNVISEPFFHIWNYIRLQYGNHNSVWKPVHMFNDAVVLFL